MPGNLCEHCTGFCCRYIALPIDTPDDESDFDDIRWYLLHDGVAVFIEDGEWFINIQTTCRHLQADFRCGIYHTRPNICRKYSTGNCDYHSGDYGWEQHFTCPEHLDAYQREFFAKHPGKGRRKSAPEKPGRPHVKARLGNPLGPRRGTRDAGAPPALDIHGLPLPMLHDVGREG